MSAYGEVLDMAGYRPDLAHGADPLEHLFKLESDLEAAEQRTATMIAELFRRLEDLEARVSSLGNRVDDSSRQLEREVVALADRIASLEKSRAA